MPNKNLPPILEHKHHAAPAVFFAGESFAGGATAAPLTEPFGAALPA
jgi:hypothetical protein